MSVSLFVLDCPGSVSLGAFDHQLSEHKVKQSTLSALIFIFKGMRSPLDHSESEGLCTDKFP